MEIETQGEPEPQPTEPLTKSQLKGFTSIFCKVGQKAKSAKKQRSMDEGCGNVNCHLSCHVKCGGIEASGCKVEYMCPRHRY